MTRRPYHRPMSRTWYLKHAWYRNYMIREMSSLFIGLWTLNLLVGLGCLIKSQPSWEGWVNSQSNSLMIGFSFITLLLALYHSWTWFHAAPKAMHLQVGDKKVSAQLITQAHLGGMILVSIVVLIAAMWGV